MACRAIKVLFATAVCAIVLSFDALFAGEIELKFTEAVSPELQSKAAQVVNRCVASRLALKQGQFKARGTVTHTYRKDPDKSYSGPVEVSSAFDFDRKLFRFDRSEHQRIRFIPNALPGETEEARQARATSREMVRVSKFALNEEKCIHWNDNAPREVRVAARNHKTQSRSMSANAFDVRLIGFPARSEFQPQTSFESQFGEYFHHPVAAVEVADSGRTKLETRFELGTRAIWFDRNQGHCPVYLGLVMADERNESLVEASANWRQIAEVWIPKDTRWTEFQYGRGGPVQVEYVLEFDWQRVNEAPDPDQFRVESFMTGNGMRVAEIKF